MSILKPSPDFFNFIETHANDNTQNLLLKYRDKIGSLDLNFALTQIECRKKGTSKLKKFLSNPKSLFPDSVAYEQASHEAVGAFHASLAHSSASVLDMTAGLGIDAMAFADICSKVVACELNETKASTLAYNVSLFGKDNMTIINADSVEWIKNQDGIYDIIFIDPARRDGHNGRVYNFRDCLPDITTLQNYIIKRCHTLLIKASPLLDITATLKDIHHVKSIRAISVKGECKEILVEASEKNDHTLNNGISNYLNANPCNSTILEEAIDLDTDGSILSRFSFYRSANSKPITYTTDQDVLQNYDPVDPQTKSFDSCLYLYEPNAPMMKLAPWEELSSRYPSLIKLAPSSHLFISRMHISDFPGRILKVIKIIDKKTAKGLKGACVNVVARNHPLTPDDIRKKYSLKEGNDTFLYATRLASKPILILAEKCLNSGHK